jgi:hypothetical protein
VNRLAARRALPAPLSLPRSLSVALPLSLLLLVAGLALHPMAESDLFFRIKAGQEILLRHGLPGRNLFSFTYPDAPDLDTSWLFEVGAAALYGAAGFPGIVLAKTVVLLATFAGAYLLCRRRGAGAAASALALAAAAFVGRERFVERPHIFSFAGEVAALAAIDLLVEGGLASALRVGVCFLAAVVVWANLHAGVFVAPLLIGAVAVVAAVDRGGRNGNARSGNARFGDAGRLAALAAASAIAALATPVGAGLYRYLRLHLALPALHPVDEFRGPTWISDAPLFVYGLALMAVVAAGGLVGGAGSPFRWSILRTLAPALPLAALTVQAVRFGADFALVSAPLLALTLTGLAARLELRWPTLRGSPLPAITVVALLVGFSLAPRLAGATPLREGIGLDTRELPLAAIAFANQNGLRDRMYNDFETGSYLLFEPVGGFPRHRVFVDPRLPAYPAEMHRLLGRADIGRDEWNAAMERYGVETALLAYAGINRRVAWWDPARWALVFRGGDARVFVRRLPRFAALIAAQEIPASFDFSVEEGTRTLPLEARPAGSPVADCEWSRRVGELLFELDGELSPRARQAYARALAAPPGCLAASDEARLCAWLGALDLEGGRAGSALELLARALARGDRDLTTFTNRAVALEALGRGAQAAEAWADVAARAGDSALAARARDRRASLLGP